MFEVGQLAVKIAGRDAGNTCVVVDVVDDQTVLIDGNVRRRNCNLKHLEPLQQSISMKKGASHADVEKEFKKLKLDVRNTTPKKPGERPRQQRKKKAKEFKVAPKEGKAPVKADAKPAAKAEKPVAKKESKEAAPAAKPAAKPAKK